MHLPPEWYAMFRKHEWVPHSPCMQMVVVLLMTWRSGALMLR